MTRLERKKAVADLRALAARFDAAADRAFTLDDEDSRRADAAQIRMVAMLVGTAPIRRTVQRDRASFAALWLAAGEKMLSYYDSADMDAVHASRSSRRDEAQR